MKPRPSGRGDSWFSLSYLIGIFLLIKTLSSERPAIFGIPYYFITIYFNFELSNLLWINIFNHINNSIIFIGINIGNNILAGFLTLIIFVLSVLSQSFIAISIDDKINNNNKDDIVYKN